jgi:2-amino-4-hydroxy-6-hydroxymethyldihydropteridine diphosphokinase
MAEAGLSLGSNIGDKAAAIDAALRFIVGNPNVRLVARSRLYRTEPWGEKNQDFFLNACALIETVLPPRDLLALCLDAEKQLGRDRTQSRRWGPRIVDVDVLFYGDVALTDADLTLPHPHMFERAFVLVPLSEIAGGRVIAGRRISEAAQALGSDGVRLWDQADTK